MAQYEVTVKVPASANGPRIPKRIIIDANGPIDAIQIANGQYGAENVIPTAKKVSD